ncbi:MAG: DUF433 domain-containing protein [Gammaproteobacteria bacterium]|nr:DUF433 domain-containing protein [Gammaproteobacteria bacterium]MBU1927312.1 DUF433 domain-containing protein [Gammaproteobacteria bacterium]
MRWMDRIVVDPKIMVGKPVIKGTRIPVELILKMLAQKLPEKEILNEYPRLKTEDIQAVLFYATNVVSSEEVYPLSLAVAK